MNPVRAAGRLYDLADTHLSNHIALVAVAGVLVWWLVYTWATTTVARMDIQAEADHITRGAARHG